MVFLCFSHQLSEFSPACLKKAEIFYATYNREKRKKAKGKCGRCLPVRSKNFIYTVSFG